MDSIALPVDQEKLSFMNVHELDTDIVMEVKLSAIEQSERRTN